MNNDLPLQPVFVCAHCSRTQRLGARWGAGTTDAAARLFCTFECAWMTLLIDEHRANYAAAAAAAAAATTTTTTTTTTGAAQPTQMASRARYPVGRRTRRRSTASKSASASNATSPADARLQQQCTPTDDGNWHAMLGMAALFGEH